MEPTTLPDLLTAKELAAYLRVDERQVYQMTNAGRVPYYDLGGRKRYVAAEVLEALRREPSRTGTVVALDLMGAEKSGDPSHLKVRTVLSS